MIRRPPRPPLFPYTPLSRSQPAGNAPYAGPGALGNAQPVGSSSGSQASQTVSTQSTTKTGPSNTREDQLISLITNTVSPRSEEHTSELQSHLNLVCRLLLEK